MKARRVTWMPLAALMLASSLGLAAHAGDRSPASQADGAIWMAVSDKTLDVLRGGFDAGGGLMVSFGIMRSTYINGQLVTQTSLNFGRITDLTPAQAAQLNRQMATLNLVQNGPGNVVQAGAASGASGGTIIQNTLNNQHIVNQTVINASSNALGMVKNLNLQDTLSDGLARAAAGR
jgi:hypothetical protein